MLHLVPISLSDACEFVAQHHRHHEPPQGGKFAIAVSEEEKICGVAIVGRPVSRMLDDGWTAEVTRVATNGTKNTGSMLYAASWRAARAMGYRKLITYTLPAAVVQLARRAYGSVDRDTYGQAVCRGSAKAPVHESRQTDRVAGVLCVGAPFFDCALCVCSLPVLTRLVTVLFFIAIVPSTPIEIP
jgi:hypothetical protein